MTPRDFPCAIGEVWKGNPSTYIRVCCRWWRQGNPCSTSFDEHWRTHLHAVQLVSKGNELFILCGENIHWHFAIKTTATTSESSNPPRNIVHSSSSSTTTSTAAVVSSQIHCFVRLPSTFSTIYTWCIFHCFFCRIVCLSVVVCSPQTIFLI